MTAGINVNTREDRKLEINRTFATDFHNFLWFSLIYLKGPEVQLTLHTVKGHQTNIHQTTPALSISSAVVPQRWPYPGVWCTTPAAYPRRHLEHSTAFWPPPYPQSTEEKRPWQGEERKGPDSPKQDEWKTRVQKDRVIVLSKGKRIIRSSKHKPQKIKENEMEIIRLGGT